MTKRIETLDIVRGITILLVVAGHSGLPTEMNDFFRNFRMPLFFLVSGYLFSAGKYKNSINRLVVNRFWTLLIPYLTAGIFTFYFVYLLSFVGRHEPSLLQHLYGILNGNGEELKNTPIWFLPCLFCSHVIFCFIYGKIQKLSMFPQGLIFFSFGIIGSFIGYFVHLPWGMDIAIVAQPLLFVGYKLKEYKLLEKLTFLSWKYIIGYIIIFLITININTLVDMNNRLYGNISLFYIGGISGSLVVIYLCNIIIPFRHLVNLLSYIRKESLLILTFHLSFGMVIVAIAHELIFKISPHWYLSLLFSVVICLVGSAFIKKYRLLNIMFNGKKYSYKGQNYKDDLFRRKVGI